MSGEGGIVVDRGKDAEGYHRPPRSSCCRSGVVVFHPGIRQYVALFDVTDMPMQDRRCGHCNRPLTEQSGRADG